MAPESEAPCLQCSCLLACTPTAAMHRAPLNLLRLLPAPLPAPAPPENGAYELVLVSPRNYMLFTPLLPSECNGEVCVLAY